MQVNNYYILCMFSVNYWGVKVLIFHAAIYSVQMDLIKSILNKQIYSAKLLDRYLANSFKSTSILLKYVFSMYYFIY